MKKLLVFLICLSFLSINIYAQTSTIGLGQSQTVFSALASPGTSSTYAIPPNATTLTWQTVYSSTPTAINIVLEGSLDSTNFNIIDTTVNTSGEVRSINTGSKFIRFRVVSSTGTFNTTLTATVKSSSSSVTPSASQAITNAVDTGWSRSNAATLLLNTTAGSTDTSLVSGWAAFRFTATNPTLGSVAVELKASAPLTGTIRAFVFNNSASLPGAGIYDTSTQLPQIIDLRGITSSYGFYEFRLPQNSLNGNNYQGCIASASPSCTPLTIGTNYWVVINTQSLAGGTLSLLTSNAATGANLYATAADNSGSPGVWTGAANITPVYNIYGDSSTALYGTSQNRYGIWGDSPIGFGGYFTTIYGTGIKGNSTHGTGTGGVSVYSVGVAGHSSNGIGIVGDSLGSFGMQSSGTVGGIQTICSSTSCVSVQSVPQGNPSIGFQILNGAGGNADTFQVDNTGNVFSAGIYGFSASSVVASAATIAPIHPIQHVSGTVAIATITVPAGCAFTCQITLIPDGIFTTAITGNIALASTAVVSKALIMTWDGTKWYPSY